MACLAFLKLLYPSLKVRDQFIAAVYLSDHFPNPGVGFGKAGAPVRLRFGSWLRLRPTAGEGDQGTVRSPDGNHIARLGRQGLAIGPHRRSFI
jgi:hypothetical protein